MTPKKACQMVVSVGTNWVYHCKCQQQAMLKANWVQHYGNEQY